MFRQQMQCIEESGEALRGRCLKFYKGCRKYTEGLGEGYDGDVAFASALETFGGGHNDPICVAFGDKSNAPSLHCLAVHQELGKYGDLENQVLCRERVEELEASIRYRRHKIGESNLKTSELLQIGEMEGPAPDLFKAKLEAAMAEVRSQQAASLTEFHWLGRRFPILNAKTRVAILKGCH